MKQSHRVFHIYFQIKALNNWRVNHLLKFEYSQMKQMALFWMSQLLRNFNF